MIADDLSALMPYVQMYGGSFFWSIPRKMQR
jgi:hypothetical protein